MGWPSRWGRGDRGRRDGESVVRKVRARNAERVGLFAFPPKEVKALEAGNESGGKGLWLHTPLKSVSATPHQERIIGWNSAFVPTGRRQ